MWMEIISALIAIIYVTFKSYYSSLKSSNKDDKKELSQKVIPGLDPSDPNNGNQKEMEEAGTISEFIRSLHKKYGPIVRFYQKTKMSVSIAEPEMLKQIRHLFESPTDLFESITLLTGKEIFTFCGVDEIKRRRKIYDQHFMMGACKTYSGKFRDLTKETAETWANTRDSLSLMKLTQNYSLNALLRCCFGDVFKNKKTFDEYQELVDCVFRNLDPKPMEGTDLYNEVVTKCNKIKDVIQQIMDERRKQKHDDDTSELFIDVLLNMDMSEAARKADVTVFISGGYFTVAMILCWFFYEISCDPEVQDKIHQEIVSVLGDQDVTVENMSKLTYLRQAIDETLRIYLSPGITARITDADMEIGGYHIPKDTTIYQSFEPLFNDPKVWEHPQKFDPDRFSYDNSRGRNPYSFKPFGFAGKRVCPGMSFALAEMIMLATEVIRRCRLHLVPGQTVEMLPGFIIAPKNEIMVTFEKR